MSVAEPDGRARAVIARVEAFVEHGGEELEMIRLLAAEWRSYGEWVEGVAQVVGESEGAKAGAGAGEERGKRKRAVQMMTAELVGALLEMHGAGSGEREKAVALAKKCLETQLVGRGLLLEG